jgi:hypothetical protein
MRVGKLACLHAPLDELAGCEARSGLRLVVGNTQRLSRAQSALDNRQWNESA